MWGALYLAWNTRGPVVTDMSPRQSSSGGVRTMQIHNNGRFVDLSMCLLCIFYHEPPSFERSYVQGVRLRCEGLIPCLKREGTCRDRHMSPRQSSSGGGRTMQIHINGRFVSFWMTSVRRAFFSHAWKLLTTHMLVVVSAFPQWWRHRRFPRHHIGQSPALVDNVMPCPAKGTNFSFDCPLVNTRNIFQAF